MNDEDCRTHLRKYRPDVHFDVLLKCWKVDFSRTENSEHFGSNTRLIRSVCDHVGMQRLVEYCRDRVNSLLEQQDIVRVACVDDRGIHRSVAVASILQAICKKKGYNTKGPFHMEKPRWKKENFCRRCEHCDHNEKKAKLYTATAIYWSE